MSVNRYFCFVILLSLVFILPSISTAMPQIMGDVETEFAVYSPYIVNVMPNMPLYYTGANLENVTNTDQFEFTDSEKAMLVQNGFVAGPGRFKQVYDVYNYCQKLEIPIFVTTDSMLHTYHILFDYTLRILEMRKFYGDLEKLNQTMLESAILQYETATDSRAIEAARRNVAYFAVASVLLEPETPIPPYVSEMVEAELTLIDALISGEPSPIFEYKEDYSQYKPRGHYTRNAEFERYFKSMMWYGRMIFHLKPREGEEKGKAETLQALLVVAAIKDAIANGEPATDVWDRIYEPTVFFVGKTDDLNVYEYMELMDEIYGDEVSPDALADDAKLVEFIAAAMELRDPMISSTFVWENEDIAAVNKGFRFMGQRFIPDSYMFQQLVHTYVWNRMLPKGLDIMAVLGSDRAYDILLNVYNEDTYPDYTKQIEKLRGEFEAVDDDLWAQNLYWNWLYVLTTLLTPMKEEGYPVFMQNQAWMDKELSTALGSWTELRHDTILYAKQSYSVETSIPMGPPLIKGYVEPNPELYARLASLAKFTRDGLSNRGLLLPEFASKFSQLEELLVSLKEISEIELEYNPISSVAPSRKLTIEQYGIIANIGGTLQEITTFPPDIASEIEGQEDNEMAVVADVHTAGINGPVLEEGVGYPLNIFVVVPTDSGLRITQGAIFSYYEFPWPIEDRLTDGQWQDMLKTAPPELPIWMASFMDMAVSQPTGERFSVAQDMPWQPTEISVTIEPDIIEIGAKIEVNSTVSGKLNSPPVARLRQSSKTTEITMKSKEESMFVSEHAATLDTSDFKPGEAQLTVSGRIGEEELLYTKNLILVKSTAVEGMDEISTSSVETSSLENRLYYSYPCPFNPEVWIPYELGSNAEVTIEIYNTLGQLIRTLDLGYKFPGRYMDSSKAAHWDGRNSSGEQVSSGIYFYKFRAGNFTAMGKMIAVK